MVNCIFKENLLEVVWRRPITLYFYNNEPSKNKHFLILLSSNARYSQEPRLKFFLKFSVFYSDCPKSWIWRTLGHVQNIFCKYYLHNAWKKVFQPIFFLNSMHGFKSAILAIFHFLQNGTYEPVHGIQSFLRPKDFFYQDWRANLGCAYSLMIHYCKNTVCYTSCFYFKRSCS